MLSSLGASDQRASEGMYEVLYEVLRRADTGINIGYAVIYECVRTITTIYPSIQLLETAANHISRFVSSENHNLKYLGIKALASIVQGGTVSIKESGGAALTVFRFERPGKGLIEVCDDSPEQTAVLRIRFDAQQALPIDPRSPAAMAVWEKTSFNLMKPSALNLAT